LQPSLDKAAKITVPPNGCFPDKVYFFFDGHTCERVIFSFSPSKILRLTNQNDQLSDGRILCLCRKRWRNAGSPIASAVEASHLENKRFVEEEIPQTPVRRQPLPYRENCARLLREFNARISTRGMCEDLFAGYEEMGKVECCSDTVDM
jgi:hypothetical protein